MRTRLKRLLWISPLFSLTAYGQHAPSTTLFRCTQHSPLKVLSTTSSGENVEGPVCAQITVNALRYGAEFSKTFTYTAGPTLTSVFPSSFAAQPEPVRHTPTLEQDFRTYEQRLVQLSLKLLKLQSHNRTAAAILDRALRNLKDIVTQSDEIFSNSGANGVVTLVQSGAFPAALEEALGQQMTWSASDKIIDALRSLQINLNGLAVRYPANTAPVTSDFCLPANINKLGWTDWYTKCREAEFKQKLAELEKLIADAGQFSSDGERAATIAKKLGIATYWKTTSDALTPDLFVRQVEVTCSPLFNINSQTTLKLTLMDRVPTFDQQSPTAQPKDNLLVVQCGSPFSITAGAAFSMIPNTEFAIVKGAATPPATTATNLFGVLADPEIHPVPMAAVHARLKETAGHRLALHASFGVGVNVRSEASGGSSAEFLMGPSVSFLRTIFLTVGAQVGKRTSLAGGFHLNDPVPTDVTNVQVTTAYTARWGFAVTFTKP